MRVRGRLGISVLMAMVFALAACLSPTHNMARPADRVSAWKQDLKYLADTLPRVHKNAFARLSQGEFRKLVSDLDSSISTLPDDQIRVGLARLVAALGDGHTGINLFGPDSKLFPISFYWFDEGIYVTATMPEHRTALGARLVAINNRSIDEVSRLVSELIARDNDVRIRSMAPQLMVLAEALYGLGITFDPNKALYTLAGRDGKQICLEVEGVPRSRRTELVTLTRTMGDSERLYRSNPSLWYWHQYLEDKNTLYVSYKRCRDMESQPTSRFFNEVISLLDKAQVERLIIDLRDNSGGDSRLMQPLIDYLSRRSQLAKQGRVFVIIGRNTFSSAILNAVDLKKVGARLVGEPTGGKPNHYGEVKTLHLPNSGIQVTYSVKYFKVMDEDAAALMPDIPVPVCFSDYVAGRNSAIEQALSATDN